MSHIDWWLPHSPVTQRRARYTTGEDSRRRRLPKIRTKTTAKRHIAAATALLTLSLRLSACSGSDDVDGEYFGEDSGDFATVVVDGNSVTYTEPQCEGENRETSVGELNEDRTLVVWIDEGRWEGDDRIAFTESTVTISTNNGDPDDTADVFSREESDAGKAIYAEHEQDCTDEASDDADDANAEQEREMAQTRAAEDKAKIEAMTVKEIADCTGWDESRVIEMQTYSELKKIPAHESLLGVELKSKGCLVD